MNMTDKRLMTFVTFKAKIFVQIINKVRTRTRTRKE